MVTIEKLIDDALTPTGNRVRSGKFVPSSFGYCFRSQYWRRKGVEQSNPADARSLRVLHAGRLFHDFVEGLLTKNNHCQTEVRIEESDILGFADLVRDNEVIDIKSQHSRSFWWMAKKDADIKKEKYGNWLQVMYYAIQLGKEFGRLIFVSKDDLCTQEYVQPVKDWTGEVEKEVITLREIWTADVLPAALPRCEPKTAKKTGDVTYWQCSYCAYLSLCQKTEAEAGREHVHNAKEVEDVPV